MSKVLLWQKPEFKATVVIAPKQPFDFEREDPLALAKGVWCAMKIMAVFWGTAIAAGIYWCS